jgi:hypothetical protein
MWAADELVRELDEAGGGGPSSRAERMLRVIAKALITLVAHAQSDREAAPVFRRRAEPKTAG